ncbi:MAG: retron St85 family effector protein [Acidobacteriia bacterium]|nr:retron St85 family effector protein [Terriglobia bacterium]
MPLWLEHPKYVPVRDRLIEYLRSNKYRFRRLAPVLFLCGGAGSARRDTLRDYLRKYASGVNLFYAESVWNQIAAQGNRNALEMESDLAALADLVIIIVESPGTFTELGAFSLSEPLRKKLVAIVDSKYKSPTEPSFISTGPLQWINSDSSFGPTVFASFSHILEAVDEIETRIARIPKPRSVRISDLASSQKHLLFFLCDLISVIHPATVDAIKYYLTRIAPSLLTAPIDIPTLVGLAVAMGLLQEARLPSPSCPGPFFYPSDIEAVRRPFHHTRHLDLESLRAAHVAVMLNIPQARELMAELRRLS